MTGEKNIFNRIFNPCVYAITAMLPIRFQLAKFIISLNNFLLKESLYFISGKFFLQYIVYINLIIICIQHIKTAYNFNVSILLNTNKT